MDFFPITCQAKAGSNMTADAAIKGGSCHKIINSQSGEYSRQS
jgi:hypothetical protein